VYHRQGSDPRGVVQAIDAFHRLISRTERGLLRLLAEADRARVWHDDGARDMAHWLAMRYGISDWKARRWLAAADALERLPCISRALDHGEIGIDKVAELARFATADDEARLLRWAQGVSVAQVRRRADAACRQRIEQAQEVERARRLEWWWFDDGRRLGLEAELPAAQGAIVAWALDRLADQIPAMPEEGGASFADARRADALVVMASAKLASDADPDRATVVVHTDLPTLVGTDGSSVPAGKERNGQLESGGIVAPETLRRLACTGRVQAVLEDAAGNPIGVGRMSREPTAAMMRLLRHRDDGCVFPGCGRRRFAEAHHIVWWRHGGRTDLDNLAMICSFHHKLVHEFGWRLTRDADGEIGWFRPGGQPYRAGPGRTGCSRAGPSRAGPGLAGPMGSSRPSHQPLATAG
jgi:hypothetical protein